MRKITRQGLVTRICAAVACAAAAFYAFPLRAAIVIANPVGYYTSQTSLIDFSGVADGVLLAGIQDANLQISFSGSMQKLTADDTWGTWNVPPQTESAAPPVLYSDGSPNLTLTLSSPVGVFGFELEPDLSVGEPVSVTFFGTGSPFTISLTPGGNAGALLFAVSSDTPITSVGVVDGAGDDFAIANVRYSPVPLAISPEPAIGYLPTAILAAMGLWIRRRRGAR